MDKLQLLAFFGAGFLLSRALIAVQLPERIVARFVAGGRHGLTRITLYLLVLSAGLSLFIPNAVTVLAVLPVLQLVRRAFSDEGQADPALSTLLGLTVIYGANIGGLGSVTATPANGIFVAWITARSIPGRELVQYAIWLSWGVPLVVLLVAVAWLLLTVTLRPWRWRARAVVGVDDGEPLFAGRRRWVLVALASFLLASTALSLAMLRVGPEYLGWVLALSCALALLLSLVLFVVPVGQGLERRALLTWRDCIYDLPARGFVLVAVAVGLGIALYLARVHLLLARWVAGLLPRRIPYLAFLGALALATSLTTEVLSNTAVQVGMSLLVEPMARRLGFAALKPLLVVTLSCTCAFMSPIATGVNGLAFGGLRGISLWRMLLVGLLMNAAAAGVIAAWVTWAVPGKLLG